MKYLYFAFSLLVLFSCKEATKKDLLVNKKWELYKVYIDNKDVSQNINECNRFTLVFYSNNSLKIIRKECLMKIESDLITTPFWSLKNNELNISILGETIILELDKNDLIIKLKNQIYERDYIFWFKFYDRS